MKEPRPFMRIGGLLAGLILSSMVTAQDFNAPADAVAAFNSAGCVGCHTIPGIPGADGKVGPGLINIGVDSARRIEGVSAGEYIRQSILDPNAFLAPDCYGNPCPPGVMLQTYAESLDLERLDTIVSYLLKMGTEQMAILARATREAPVSISTTRPPESVLKPFLPLPVKPAIDARIALGKYLFFDKRLSGNVSLSCASCHESEKAFTDGQAMSRGYPSTRYFRNTQSIYNAVFADRLYRDGRMAGGDLPTLVRDHLTEAHFMSMDGRLMVERLRQIPAYAKLFEQAFGGEPSFGRVLKAITAYVSTLNSLPVAYDAALAGDTSGFSPDALVGYELFRGKAGCSRCHVGPLLTDERFYNLGLGPNPDLLGDSERALTLRRFFRVLGAPNYRNLREDTGLFALTLDMADKGRFKTPGLREVARTVPYMHDGSLATLDDVVRFYNDGGGASQTAGLKPLGLSDRERAQLVAFLESLSSDLPTVRVPELPDYAVLTLGEAQPLPIAAPMAVASSSVPPLAPLPAAPVPLDNPVTPEKVDLGKLLFFDPRMSGDGSMSCNSCHPATTGWGAPTAISFGGPGTSHWRNAQTLMNVAYYSRFNWDGAKKSIEQQNSGAWGGAVAGNLDKALGEERLAQIPAYVQRFRDVFGTDYPSWSDALRAVASYERTLVSRNVPLDAYLRGDRSAIPAAARRGLDLFNGKAGCIRCHNGPLASGGGYHALGVPPNPDFLNSPLKQITFRYEFAVKGVPEEVYRTADRDYGFYFVSKQNQDIGKFRTPSLRDLCYTAPYMHNGVYQTLEEVVAFYNEGGGDVPNKDLLIHPLGLSEREQTDLVTLLKSLCGERVSDEAPELPPYGGFVFPDEEVQE